jgi:AAA domain
MTPRSYCREALRDAEVIDPYTDIPYDDAPPVNGPEDYGLANGAAASGRANGGDGRIIPELGERDAGDDVELPRPRSWLLENQFCRKFLSGIVAPGSTGKSALRLAQCLSLTTGRWLTGQHVFKRCRALIISLDDDAEEMHRRILAARIRYGITLDEVKGWLFYATPKGMKLAEMSNGSRQIGLLEKSLRAAIERRRPDLVVLDPYVKLHALEENDNGAMDFVCDLLATLAIEYDIAIDAPHHTKKGQLTPGDADSGRGASAIRDAGRLIYTLTTMSEDEAKAFGINPEERTRYIRLDKGKVNLAPPSRTATWFKLVGVRLENGNDEYPNGDEVHTVEPWSPPKTWEGLSSETLNAALTDIDAGTENGQRYSGAPAAGKRAAWRVVKKHCPNRTEAQCKEIIRTWVRNGVLYEDEYDDPVDRKLRNGLRLDATKRPS